MDPLYLALSAFRRRKFEKCIEICTNLLSTNPYDQAVWSLKTRALTEEVWVDECDGEEEGLADVLMDDNTIASVARPGTSLRTAPPSSAGGNSGPSQAFRPATQSGRPLSGVVRPGSQGGRPGTMDQALRTPRTAQTARPVSAASGRHVRLGTASMLPSGEGPFINLARLNVAKYASQPNIAKALFEYIYYHENDVRHALDLAAQATQAQEFKDWWWKVQLGRCYYRLGLFRDAEKQFKSALQQQDNINTFLLLGRVYIRLDQPMAALEIYKSGLDKFPGEVTLLTAIARIYEGLHDLTKAVKFYKDVLHYDATHVEAIACIGTNHFYTDQPEVALRFYRRLLQMGIYNCEIFNNLGLCCFYAQQYDMTLTCFERALSLATDESVADVWYNLGHIALGIGDINLAYQCFRLALVANNDHGESYNNLGVLEYRRGNYDTARAFFMTSATLAPHMFQPHFNHSKLAHKTGDLQTSYIIVQKALQVFPAHVDSKELLSTLETHFHTL
ncbi:tetratricopeptide repeat protein 8-like [Penaeus indicus]|uniref:tetratricopeptide repeat protein 8-like n=1 Tax=Penaeus indicus TaxID=29960 RepID=UPI00300C1DAA